jgi:2-polyprenyl-3-methyl-5-hydroxy-6-metoxy-1,4-benzoquinol methylase
MDLKELPRRAFKRHPWEIARANFFLGLLREHLGGTALRALDIGSGDGYFARRLLADLQAVATVTCFDPAYDAGWLEGHAQSQQGLAFTAERPGGTFDLVLLLDVLEHTADDQALLHEAATSFAKPGSWLLLSAPAHHALFSRHDQLLGHRRRYSPVRLRALAAEVGLNVVAHGQLFASLLLPRALAKLGEVMRGGSAKAVPVSGRIETPLGTWHHGDTITSVVKTVLALDAAGSQFAARWRLALPGLSTWVLARRR